MTNFFKQTYRNSNIPHAKVTQTISNKPQINYAGKPKHYPPANKEWSNSVYAYNRNTIKVLPSTDKTLAKLIKGYFDLYSRKLENRVKKKRSRRFRVRRARASTNRILVSRAELKHTSDRVIITVYIYNSQKRYYINKLSKIPAIDKLGKLLLDGWTLQEQLNFITSKVSKYVYGDSHKSANFYKAYNFFSRKFYNGDYISELPRPLSLFISDLKKDKNKGGNEESMEEKIEAEKLRRKNFLDYAGAFIQDSTMENLSKKVSNLKLNAQSQKRKLYIYLKNNKLEVNKDYYAIMWKTYENNYVRAFAYKFLRKEIVSVYFKQLLRFNKLKFENRYISPLREEISKIYGKQIEFNFVNLKHLYLSGSIFSSTLVDKIKNRKNRFLKILKDSLEMFDLPPINRKAIYDEIYNRKRMMQNLGINGVLKRNSEQNTTSSSDVLTTDINAVDLLEKSLSNVIVKKDMKAFKTGEVKPIENDSDTLKTVITGLKNKSVSGIRIELAGRLTKRNTAARSLFKLRYKGNIRNTDSSDKGLSAVMLRGHAKSNLEFVKHKSKIRIGSYGFKGWVSTS